jgi:hypothetical protein
MSMDLLRAIWAAFAFVATAGAMDGYAAGTCAHGELATRSGSAIARADGTPADIGAAIGALCAPQIATLARAVAPDADAKAMTRIPADYRPELEALAGAAHVSADALATANLVVDPGCSALASVGDGERPTLIARNMDFAPVALLGPGTLVEILRRDGQHALASVGWPGFIGVVSGINDAGVCACVLLNLAHGEHRRGEPICFRVRRLLEQAASLDEAAKLFAASPVASSHYIFVADVHGAAVLWQDLAGFHRQEAADGWLACTNAPRDAKGEPADARGQWLLRQRAQSGHDEAWMRRALGGCWLPDLNAQAMVFAPASLRLQLATGTALKPAALCAWRELDLGPLLAGKPIADDVVRPLPRVEPLPRYDAR